MFNLDKMSKISADDLEKKIFPKFKELCDSKIEESGYWKDDSKYMLLYSELEGITNSKDIDIKILSEYLDTFEDNNSWKQFFLAIISHGPERKVRFRWSSSLGNIFAKVKLYLENFKTENINDIWDLWMITKNNNILGIYINFFLCIKDMSKDKYHELYAVIHEYATKTNLENFLIKMIKKFPEDDEIKHLLIQNLLKTYSNFECIFKIEELQNNGFLSVEFVNKYLQILHLKKS